MTAAIIARLRRTGQQLPERTRTRVLALGDAAIPELIEILADERLAEETAPGDGWPPIHAVRLLAELRAEAAIDPMLQLLRAKEFDTILDDQVRVALPKLGPAVVEPVLRLYAEDDDRELRSGLAGVLAGTGVRDERIFRILLDELREDPLLGCCNLAEYADPRGLEPLQVAFEAYEGNEGFVLREFRHAIETLGGVLTDAQREKIERGRDHVEVDDSDDRELEDDDDPVEPPGRNETCWCGSNRKYKKCHLAEDERSGQD